MEGGVKKSTTFVYPEIVHSHFAYRDVIDNHNAMRMHPISMEETWMTSRWSNRVLCFLLALTMVNVQNAGCYFAKLPKIDAIHAHKLIAQQLILNKYIQNAAQSHCKCGSTDHKLVALPTFRKFKNSTMVRCKDKYQKWNCSCKATHVRSYCFCSPGIIQCVECYATHCIDIETEDLI